MRTASEQQASAQPSDSPEILKDLTKSRKCSINGEMARCSLPTLFCILISFDIHLILRQLLQFGRTLERTCDIPLVDSTARHKEQKMHSAHYLSFRNFLTPTLRLC